MKFSSAYFAQAGFTVAMSAQKERLPNPFTYKYGTTD